MATIYLSLSAKEDSIVGSEVLIRFTHGRINQRAKTGVFVLAQYWDKDTQNIAIPKYRLMSNEQQRLVEQLTYSNDRLDDIRAEVMSRFIDGGAGRLSVSSSWLKSIVEKSDSPHEHTFFELFDEFLDRRKLSDWRVRSFHVLIRALRRYELYTKKSHRGFVLSLDSITERTLDSFDKYLRTEHITLENNPDLRTSDRECRVPRERGQNTISGMMIKLRTFFIWANDNDLTKNNPFRRWRICEEVYGTPIYISVEERNKLYHTNLSRHPKLAVQRDIFIFQCLIGCRVGDLLKMSESNIVNDAVEYIPRKTKDGRPVTVRIPLAKDAKEIIRRYINENRRGILPFISEQKYNDAIKRCFFAAGLKRRVTILDSVTREPRQVPLYEIASSHMARRTFVGNIYKQVKDPNLVGALSGHKEGSKAFARYRDIDEQMKIDLVRLIE